LNIMSFSDNSARRITHRRAGSTHLWHRIRRNLSIVYNMTSMDYGWTILSCDNREKDITVHNVTRIYCYALTLWRSYLTFCLGEIANCIIIINFIEFKERIKKTCKKVRKLYSSSESVVQRMENERKYR